MKVDYYEPIPSHNSESVKVKFPLGYTLKNHTIFFRDRDQYEQYYQWRVWTLFQ